ncbi:MAG: hypothetical protein A2452_05940 [Candidatus Firestonebacteria bacterium RIFOXYC2_FULL_39_67]|nr:MAG: hypothetical protein A2536_12525 [Candidatus Firestonebacteria bacterium RIFOXYD2_FULL_39_29]OGF56629.1 MAG: hypothetical protein A2452_05940 [Candidatus Firestonebacteria bacterium RIFOXYC2_FULL_39_67]OGF57105.1 MAG: hypothetical protein A2497_04485 [Candidatus Firestonebacteria bacterium RifOxyC12_full_39_7]
MPKKTEKNDIVITRFHKMVSFVVCAITLFTIVNPLIFFRLDYFKEAQGLSFGIGIAFNLSFMMFMLADKNLRVERLTSKFHYLILLILSCMFLFGSYYGRQEFSYKYAINLFATLSNSVIFCAIIGYVVRKDFKKGVIDPSFIKLMLIYFIYSISLALFCSGLTGLSNLFPISMLFIPLLFSLKSQPKPAK